MNIGSRSEGHAGGTRAPSRWVKGGPPPGIRVRRAPDVVPHRAPEDALERARSAEFRRSWRLRPLRGTKGHDSLRASERVQWRAR